MGAEQRGSPLRPLSRGERWEKIPVREPSAAFDPPWEEPGQPRGLASSAEVWGEPVGLCPVASQGGAGRYETNPLPVYASRWVPHPQKPDGALGRHSQDLSDWHETPMPSTGQEMRDGLVALW